ncbi:MAG: 50S ribosomal protein L23 [Christensenellales bacterium]|jgi:large subunit ribosomal protein L23
MKHLHDIIIRPVLTENTYDMIADKRYAFEVDIRSNKTEIRQAVEAVFGVKVAKVNTMRTPGKMKRQGKTQGRTPEVKKAIVQLTPDSKPIEFFEGMA